MVKDRTGRFPRRAAWLLYVALALLMTWPLVRDINTRLAGSDTDIYECKYQ